MIGIPLGLLYSNAVEWVVHKYILHGIGKKKGSWWSFHWREHHRNCRKYGMWDPDFEKPFTDWNARGKEAAGIGFLLVAHLPLFPVAPYFTAAVVYSSLNYLHKHEKAHRDPEWALEHMKWHVDHHMGKNQDANWCVTQPWFDWLMRTRIDYDKNELRVLPPPVSSDLPSGVYPQNEAVANDVSVDDADDDAESGVPPSMAPPTVAA